MSENVQRMQTRAAVRKSREESKRAAVSDAEDQPVAPPAKKRRALENLPNNTARSSQAFENPPARKRKSSVQSQEVTAEIPKQMRTGKSRAVIQAGTTSRTTQQTSDVSGLSGKSDENAPPSNSSTVTKIRIVNKRPLRDITRSVTASSLKQRITAHDGSSCSDRFDEIGVPKGVNDIDSNRDPQMCSTYASEIYEHMRLNELRRRYCANYMERVQTDINCGMRAILVDWLVEVAEEYKLVPDTLYLTVSYIDQYLSGNRVPRQRLQLLGVSCMLIAAKFEEVCAPQIDDFVYITDNTYTKDEVLEMERSVLRHLGFDLSVPTTKVFLRRFLRAAQSPYKAPSLQFDFLGNYLAEITLLEYSFLQFPASMIAASAVFLARVVLEPLSRPWTETLRHYTRYLPSELEPCVKAIQQLHWRSSTLPGVREKYKQHKFKCVGELELPMVLPSHYFDDTQLGT